MASPITTISSFCSSSYARSSCNSKPTMYSIPSCSCSYSSSNSCLKDLNFPLSSRFSQMGLCHFTPWNGLKHMGISISPNLEKIGRRAKSRGKGVYASLFGVGAPEALVIGVVALLVFGPKGLAEVARNLGKTLRAFQPTIRELQEVSREFKSTLEKEIGLDDDLGSMRNTYQSNRANTSSPSVPSWENSQNVSVTDPNGAAPNNAYSSEEYLKITEEQLKAAAAAQQDATFFPPEIQVELQNQSQDSNPPNGASSSEDYVNVTGEQLEASVTTQQDVTSSPPDSEPQVALQETAVTVPPTEKPVTET